MIVTVGDLGSMPQDDDCTSTDVDPPAIEQEPRSAWETHAENPFNWSAKMKWRQFFAGSLVTLLVGINSTVIATPGAIIARHFNVDTQNPSLDNTVWPITAWNTGAAFGPMIGIPLLEAFGMRSGYLITFALFFLFVVPQAVAHSFATVIASRAVAGVFGGVLLNCLACFVADMWLTDAERGFGIILFVLIYISGVTIGPTFGAIVAVVDWRWVFYIQLIIYGALFPLLIFVVKETRGPVICARLSRIDPNFAKAITSSSTPSKTTSSHQDANTITRIPSTAPTSSSSLKLLLYTATIRPFHMLFTEPVVIAFTLWSAFCFGIVYTCIQSISQIYSTNYGFTDVQCGLLQVSVLIGLLLGLPPSLLQNAYYQRSTLRNNNIAIPERRLPAPVLASLVGLTGGLFCYAWSSYPHVHWILPTIGLVLIGFGVQIIVAAVALYIADAYSLFAGSALSAVGFGENLMAAWLPLASRRMYDVLGFRWASAVLGFGALGLTAAPVMLLVWGEKVRGRSRFIQEARYLG